MKLVFAFLFFASLSMGSLSNSVVKIISGRCGSSQVFYGSGLLLKHNQKVFVITSDHVVLHNYQFATCHQIVHESMGRLKVNWRVAEWGNGLAILDVDSPLIIEDILSLQNLKPVEPVIGAKVSVVGFPAELTTFFTDDRGRIHSQHSAAPYFPLTENLIEIHGAHGEFGMSGGLYRIALSHDHFPSISIVR